MVEWVDGWVEVVAMVGPVEACKVVVNEVVVAEVARWVMAVLAKEAVEAKVEEEEYVEVTTRY